MSEADEGISSPEEDAELEFYILRTMGNYKRALTDITIEIQQYPPFIIEREVERLFNAGKLARDSAGLFYKSAVPEDLPEQSSVGVKHDQGKLRFDLLSVEALEGTAAALTYGAAKYADRNWEKGMAWGRPFRALLGHLFNHWRGEEIDAESGLPHIDLAACNMMFLQHYFKTKTGTDNRPKPQEK